MTGAMHRLRCTQTKQHRLTNSYPKQCQHLSGAATPSEQKRPSTGMMTVNLANHETVADSCPKTHMMNQCMTHAHGPNGTGPSCPRRRIDVVLGIALAASTKAPIWFTDPAQGAVQSRSGFWVSVVTTATYFVPWLTS